MQRQIENDFLKIYKTEIDLDFSYRGGENVDKEYTTLKTPFLLLFSTRKSTEIIFLETEEELIEMGEEINKRGGKVLEAMEIA